VSEGEPSPPVRVGARSVLLVDDTPVIRHLAHDVLAEAGYEAHSAEDGVAALGFLRAREVPVDVVITDLSMPQMDGFALIRELRQLSPKTRIVLMTGYVDALELCASSPEQPDLILPKPFRPPELLDAVSAVLRPSRPRS
jgi:CheY-like chemotaxis protein